MPFLLNRTENLFWEHINEEPINFDHFEDLFAKVPVEPKKKRENRDTSHHTNLTNPWLRHQRKNTPGCSKPTAKAG